MSCCRMGPNGGCCGESWCQPPTEKETAATVNPNPMNSRCGLEDCDCEYTIGGLLRRLELIAEEALNTVIHTRQEAEALTDCHAGLCGTGCPCYQDGRQDGYETERQRFE
ncbi:hypothetical protein LCGC14_2602260 [marine sediment metagenome]|uniref:Uncharacterized protein n=1 Tax=marine sediment metagenome TaxID=412755 RepID=A0A0F9A8E5_9ZZZZ